MLLHRPPTARPCSSPIPACRDVFNIFLGALFGGTVLAELKTFLTNPSEIWRALGSALPAASNFFMCARPASWPAVVLYCSFVQCTVPLVLAAVRCAACGASSRVDVEGGPPLRSHSVRPPFRAPPDPASITALVPSATLAFAATT